MPQWIELFEKLMDGKTKNTKMKIAYIYTGLLTIGGADRVLTDKANYFADKMNFDVFIITDSPREKSSNLSTFTQSSTY